MADLSGPNPDEVNGLDARDAPLTANPLLTGARASTATPTAVSADNDSVDLWATRFGALNVVLRDTTGAAIATGAQYVEDAALGAVGTGQGTLIIGRASAAAPTSVSADADAVGLWASRFGALNIIPRDTAGAALTTVAAALADATANPTVGGGQTFGMTFNGTNWDRMRGTATSLADALTNPGAGLVQDQTFLMAFNGTTWDRVVTAQGVTAGANTDRGVLASGIGPGFSRIPATSAAISTVTTSPVFNVNGAGTVIVQLTGTFTGLAGQIEGTTDGSTWFTIPLAFIFSLAGTTLSAALVAATSPQRFWVAASGMRQLRVNVTAIASGSFTVDWTAAPTVLPITSSPVGPNLTNVVTMGNPADGQSLQGSLRTNSNIAVLNGGGTLDTGRGANADGQAATGILAAGNMLYNGTTWDRIRGAAGVTGVQAVGGLTAADGVLAAAPVTVGGRGSTAIPTNMSTDGDVTDLWLSRHGSVNVILRDSSGTSLTTAAQAFTDAFANPTVGGLASFGQGFNGTTWDRLRTIGSLDAAPNVDTGILAVGAGPGWDRKQNPAGVSATSTASAVTVEVDGADVVTFAFTTIGVTPGSMIIETSHDDGTTWVTSGSLLKLGAETWVNGAFVPAVGDAYMCRTTGVRRVRVRVNAVYASGTVTVKWTSSLGVALIKAMDLAPQPHNIGQAVLNYQSASLGVTTSGVAIAATAGKRVYVTSVRVSAGGTTAGTLAIYSGTGAFTEGTSPTVISTEFVPSATSKPGVVLNFPVPWASPTVNEDIRITTTGLTATHIQIQYYIA